MRTLAMELGGRGIAVNAVCVGSTATELNLREMPREAMDHLTSLMHLEPRGLMPPERLAGTYIFLASPAASDITGQSITVDRGQYMG